MYIQQKKYIPSEWIGKRYGNLVIKDYRDKHFICDCDCGNEKAVKPSFLFNGKVQTCGLNCPIHKAKNPGKSKTRLYRIWDGMRQRCNNPNKDKYDAYGGRGIKVCEEWNTNFYIFEKWALANGYRDDLTIDRIDGDKGYSPDNCRWATYQEQRDNAHDPYFYKERPKTKRFYGEKYEINGEWKPLSEWCFLYDVSVPFVRYRMKQGMTLEAALTTPKYQGVAK